MSNGRHAAPAPLPTCAQGYDCARTTALAERQHAQSLVMGEKMAGLERKVDEIQTEVRGGFRELRGNFRELDAKLDSIAAREAKRYGAEEERRRNEDRGDKTRAWAIPLVWRVVLAVAGVASAGAVAALIQIAASASR